MAKKTKTRQIILVNESGSFKTLFKKFTAEKKNYDFEGLSALRNLLSNEKARILNVIKLKICVKNMILMDTPQLYYLIMIM